MGEKIQKIILLLVFSFLGLFLFLILFNLLPNKYPVEGNVQSYSLPNNSFLALTRSDSGNRGYLCRRINNLSINWIRRSSAALPVFSRQEKRVFSPQERKKIKKYCRLWLNLAYSTPQIVVLLLLLVPLSSSLLLLLLLLLPSSNPFLSRFTHSPPGKNSTPPLRSNCPSSFYFDIFCLFISAVVCMYFYFSGR